MTQPTTQAIQQAREIAAECWNAKGLGLPDDILAGRCDHFFPVQAALRALSVSASKREELEARVKDLEVALKPFADFATIADTDPSEPAWEKFIYRGKDAITFGHLRSARAALNGATRP